MKFLYIDESGNNPDDRFLAFFALQIDAYKLKKAMRDARPLLKKVGDAYPEDLKELKSSKLVNGKGGWKNVAPEQRKALFIELCSFVDFVGGDGYCFLVDREKYSASVERRDSPVWASTPWLTAATAIAVLVQRQNQQMKNNKGLSVIIFDDNKMELPRLSEFLMKSSPDIEQCYERGRKAEPFDHIIDTAFAIKSEHSRLVQISDACAYALRRRAELGIGGQPEEWEGEKTFFDEAVRTFSSRMNFPSRIWVNNPICAAAGWLKDIGIVNLNKWAL